VKRRLSMPLGIAITCLATGVVRAMLATSRADANYNAADASIAVVDVERVYSSLDELGQRNTDLQAQAQSLQAKIDEQAEKIEGLRNQIQALGEGSISKRRELEIQLFEQTGLLQGRQQAFQQKLNLEEGVLVRQMYAKIVSAVEEVGQRDGYNVVLFDTRRITLPKGGVDAVNAAILSKSLLYVDNKVDITDEVITKMNNDFSAGR